MDTATRNWISTIVGALIANGLAAVDLFAFHRIGDNADLLLIVSGLGALGLHVALTTNTASVGTGSAPAPAPNFAPPQP